MGRSKKIFKIVLVFQIFLLFFKTDFVFSEGVEESNYCLSYFSKDIYYGDSGENVLLLQAVLNSFTETRLGKGGEIGSPGKETGYFGNLTFYAVKSFQEKYPEDILEKENLTKGTGVVGPYTRKKLTEVCLGLASLENIFVDKNKSRVGLIDEENVVDAYYGDSDKDNLKLLSNFGQKEAYDNISVLFTLIVILFFVYGFNFIFWGFVGGVRMLEETIKKLFTAKKKQEVKNVITKDQVAALVPAHNEELVIAKTIDALSKLLDIKNIHVVSDGSSDKTGEIARSFGVNLLELNPGKGKAGALEYAVKYFEIQKKFKAIVIVDADTRLVEDYFEHALPLFNDDDVVAVAGYAKTMWHPESLNWKQKLVVLHRDRMYFLFQRFVKFGQTWKYANVAHIVPGFASMYRTSVLDKVNMNPSGLVIEDFNMTFEVHHNKLGRITHNTKVVAYTQDPDNLGDYYRQIKRWHLGFWQTIRLHKMWLSKFWFFMALTLIESVVGSLVFLLMPILLVLVMLFAYLPLKELIAFEMYEWINLNMILLSLFAIWFFDYTLSIIAAIGQKRKEYLIFGPFFIFLKFVDAVAFLFAIPKAFFTKSNGKWVSPTRRSIN